jgi:hypothetical protein
MHPGQVVYTECSNRRPESVIQAEKAQKAAKRAQKEQWHTQQDELAGAIAEYEQDMAVEDAVEDTQFPRHRDKTGMYLYATWKPLIIISQIHWQIKEMDWQNDPMPGTGAHLERREK